MTIVADGDTWVDKTNRLTNYGSALGLKVRPTSGSDYRTLIKFDLTPIQSSCTVSAASLEILQQSSNDQTIEVLLLTQAWVESDVTWDTSPAFDTTAWATFSGNAAAPITRSIDVTSLVQSWVDGSNENFGLMLMATSGSGEIQFASRETSNPPRLVITYGP